MGILRDHGTPAPLRHVLTGHTISTAAEMGWSELSNGELLKAAEEHFDALITTDQSLRFQQNLGKYRLAILVLPTTSWPRLRDRAEQIVTAVAALRTGEVMEINFS